LTFVLWIGKRMSCFEINTEVLGRKVVKCIYQKDTFPLFTWTTQHRTLLWLCGAFFTSKNQFSRRYWLSVSCFNLSLTLSGVSADSHSLKAQLQKTVLLSTSDTSCHSQVVAWLQTDQLSIGFSPLFFRFDNLQRQFTNSRKHFTYVYLFIIKDTNEQLGKTEA
jgi:hypothetical protein